MEFDSYQAAQRLDAQVEDLKDKVVAVGPELKEVEKEKVYPVGQPEAELRLAAKGAKPNKAKADDEVY